MTDSIARVIVDVSGNIANIVSDGGVNRLATTTSITSSVLPSGAATEATLNSIDSKDFATEATLSSSLNTLNSKDFATETTLSNFRTDFNNEDFATETTLSSSFNTLNNKDFATETTLSNFRTDFNNEDFATETTLSSSFSTLNNKDFATETTLSSSLNTLNSKDFATETTLSSSFNTLNSKDFATETTLSNFRTDFNNEDFATETTLSSSFNTLNNKDFATETTLSGFRTDFNNEDFATETTLSSSFNTLNNKDFATETTLSNFRTDFNNEDFATETTQATLLTETQFTSSIEDISSSIAARLNILGQKVSAGSAPVVISSDQSPIPVSQSGIWTVQQGTPPWAVKGTDSTGSAPTENPVLFAGQDGTNVRTVLTDASGHPRVVGAGATGSVLVGDPVRVAGSDGTNTRDLKTNAAGRAENVLFDGLGNPVAVVLDNSIYRLETRSSIVGQQESTGSEKKVSVIDDATNSDNKRLLVEADFKPGATVAIGNPPLVSAVEAFLTDDGTATGSRDMIVNGATTPVEFYFPADSTDDIFFNTFRLVMAGSAITFNGASWFKGTSLTNGVLVEAQVNSGSLLELGNLQFNEDLLHLAGTPVIELGGNNVVIATLPFSGREKLAAGTTDFIKVTIRDNFTAGGLYGAYWFQASFYGFKEE